MENELNEFDQLQADVSLLVAPVRSLAITDKASSDEAMVVGKKIKALLKRVEERRDELVRPLNERTKEVNEYAKRVKGPMLEAEAHIKDQMRAWAEKCAAAEREAAKAAEAARLEAERRAGQERARIQAQAEAALAAERERLEQEADNIAALFGPAGPLDDHSDAGQEEARAAAKARIDRERMVAEAALSRQLKEEQKAIKAAHKDAEAMKPKGTRQVWDFEIVDLDKVPRDYMAVLSPVVREAIQLGVREIPGLRIFSKTSVSI